MKEGWTYKKLGEVCDILDYMRKPITKGKRETGSIPYYGATGCLDFVKDFIFDEKLVLLGEDGAKWGSGENSAYIIDGKSWVNNHAHVLRPKRDILIDEFLVYYLNYENLQPFITGVTVPKLNQEKMRSIIIPVTSNKEQQRIVSRLDAAFSHIDELKVNAEKRLSEARALFQKSLAKAMEPKEGWKEMFLGKIAYIFSGYAFKSADFKDYGKYQVLRIGNIKQNLLRLSENAVFIDKIDDGLLKKSLLQKGDLVITQTGTRHKRDYGFVAMVDKINLLLNQRNACLRFDNVITAKFFLYYSYTELFKDSFFANEGGTVGQGNVGLGTLKDMCCHFPPLSEQQRIVERLDALSAHVRDLEENQKKIISECDALKQALLRKVFE